MADTSLLTRCPHCDTRFRVTDEQLAVAKGKVRCGSCMDIFDAREHQISSVSETPARTDQPQTDSQDESDLIFQDNPEEDAAEGPYAGNRLNFSDDELSDSFRSFDETRTANSDDDDDSQIDESWAEAMLEDEFLNESSLSARPEDRAIESKSTPRDTGKSDTSEPTSSAPEPKAPMATRQEPTWSEFDEQDEPADSPTLQPRTSDHETEPQPLTAMISADADPATPAGPARVHRATTPYDELSREPVAVGRPRGSARGWLWSLVVLALIAGLVSQLAWFQFDRLSAIPELRPWYERACDLAGCELTPLTALDRIQSRQLVVRTDPENRNALLVDAVIINQADFEQPFPAIALTFSNLNGDVVAQSVFAPVDYLASDSHNLLSMAPGTPVRIAISIRDPGRDAVNYNLRFVPAQSPVNKQAVR